MATMASHLGGCAVWVPWVATLCARSIRLADVRCCSSSGFPVEKMSSEWTTIPGFSFFFHIDLLLLLSPRSKYLQVTLESPDTGS
jgi:hypothetical protein